MPTTIAELIQEFDRKPATVAHALRQFRDADRGEFLDQSLRVLLDLPDGPGTSLLLRMVVTGAPTLERLRDVNLFSTEDAIKLARRMQDLNPAIDVQLLLLPASSPNTCRDSLQTVRLLEIVGAISDGNRIQVILRGFIRHSDSRVRSKAALLIGRFTRNLIWLEQQLSESDSRLRANAVEALWGVASPGGRRLLMAATKDQHHRVAGNGLVGLYRAGDLVSASVAQSMANHSDPMFRAAAAWAMGETRDPRFLPVLAQLAAADGGFVHRNALRARARILRAVADRRASDPLKITALCCDAGLRIRARTAQRAPLAGLPPTAFMVMDSERAVEIDCVQTMVSAEYEITLSEPPCPGLRVCVHTTSAMGECIATEASRESGVRRPGERRLAKATA